MANILQITSEPMTPKEVLVILNNFCREEAFKKFVDDSISKEILINNLCQSYNLDSKIKAKVESEMNNFKRNIEESTGKVVKSALKEKLPLNVTSEITTQLPNHLMNQLPIFLNNSHQMNQILDAHSQQLKSDLKTLRDELFNQSKKAIDLLMGEEQYQFITTSHLNNMSFKYNADVERQLQENRTKFDENAQRNTLKINETLEHVKQQTGSSLSKFENFNTQVEALKLKLENVERTAYKSRELLETHNIINMFTIGGICTIALTGVFYLLNKTKF